MSHFLWFTVYFVELVTEKWLSDCRYEINMTVLLGDDWQLNVCLSGQLWSWRRWVCDNTAGTDDNALGDRQNHVGHGVPWTWTSEHCHCRWDIELCNSSLVTACCELHKVLFLALCVIFLFVYEISRDPLNRFAVILETAFRYSYYFVDISEAINKAAEAWGVDCKRYEIRELTKLYYTLLITKTSIK